MNEIIKKRIIAYLIDGIILGLPLQILAVIFWDTVIYQRSNYLLEIALVVQFIPFILYFSISEFFFSKTIGKKIMNLKVEYESSKISSVFIRTLSRLIPLELISFIFYEDKLLHDVLSHTKVVSGNE